MVVLDEVSVLIVAQTLQNSSDQRRIASPFILLAEQLVIVCRRGVSKRSIEAVNDEAATVVSINTTTSLLYSS